MIQNLDSYNDLEKDEKKLTKLVKKYDSVKDGIEKLKIQMSTFLTIEENKDKLVEIEKDLGSFPNLTMKLIEKWKLWNSCVLKKGEIEDLTFERVETDENIENLELERRPVCL